MSALLTFVVIFVIIFGLLCLLDFWIRDEVGRQIHRQGSLEMEHLEAVHAIKDEMRASSHRLLAAAIDPEDGQFDVIDAEDLDSKGH